MIFLWPSYLFLLGLVPLTAAAYLWMQRRRRRYAVRYASLALVRPALGAQSRWRRILPPALLLAAMASLVIGLARPAARVIVPAGRATVMLAMDVSGSMRQNDIAPSRLAAAKEAALSFVERQQATNQIGLVAFAGFAQVIQPPTDEGETLSRAIRSLTTARRTAIGSGILTALDAIAEVNPRVASSISRAEGEYEPDIIVLLTDGVSNAGPDPLEAAFEAANRGVRVYTIGYGTQRGGADQGDGFFRGGPMNWGIDEASLREIAALTGGTYYSAASSSELHQVFASLPTLLITRQETTELSVLFAALGALLVISALWLGQRWHPLP